MKKGIIVGLILLLAVLGCSYFLNQFENYEDIYYTQIDNSKIQKIDDDDMKYEYKLDCYKDTGDRKVIKFKTVRELRESAFLKLYVRIFGVYKWEEIEVDELPVKVQHVYKMN